MPCLGTLFNIQYGDQALQADNPGNGFVPTDPLNWRFLVFAGKFQRQHTKRCAGVYGGFSWVEAGLFHPFPNTQNQPNVQIGLSQTRCVEHYNVARPWHKLTTSRKWMNMIKNYIIAHHWIKGPQTPGNNIISYNFVIPYNSTQFGKSNTYIYIYIAYVYTLALGCFGYVLSFSRQTFWGWGQISWIQLWDNKTIHNHTWSIIIIHNHT